VVGRDETCDTRLPGSEISRRHAEFHADGPVVAVRDLKSRNGVFVNGVRRMDAPILRGDVVRCGEWIGVAVAEADGAPGFQEIAAGWYGGATLAAATEPARRVAADLATAELAIVVQGETGTGKEGMAQAIHAGSGRGGPFVAVNCAALPSELAEAELFGYRKGAFTGAHAASVGLFRAADGGSLFLDEILELPLSLQPKLLRVLEERKVRALGETRDVAIDVRVIAATQEPLADAVAGARFRADLQARLEGLTVTLPPLRERREDIVPLFLQFVRSLPGQAPAGPAALGEPKMIEALCLYDWPLNVRELALCAKRLAGVHGRGGLWRRSQLPERMLPRTRLVVEGASGPVDDTNAAEPAASGARAAGEPRARRKTTDETEFDALIAALRTHGGSVAQAARAIGVGRARAYRLLSAHPDFSLDDVRRPP
jgi:transcriptional regulator with PAS, ATPase and Fis domain